MADEEVPTATQEPNQEVPRAGSPEFRDEKGRFTPGHGGGPGAPKGAVSLKGLLREHLEGIDPTEKESRAHKFIAKVFNQALKGDPTAQKLIFNYIEGLPQAVLDVTSGGKPLPILGGLSTHNSDETDSSPEEAA